MAIFHIHSQHIGRSKGRSSVAAAAYRSASKLTETIFDKNTGMSFEIVHDYRNKEGVAFSAIMTPDNAPSWMKDRELLWNKIQNEFDTRKNSVFCQEMDAALPVELTEEQNISLLKEFVYETFVKEGMVVDLNLHLDNPENPHAHIMLSTREIILGEGEEYTFGNKVRHWDSKDFLLHVRRMWAGTINKHLEMAGIDERVSHLSHKERGLDIVPTIKEGVARNLNQVGKDSERFEINEEIRQENNERIKNNPELIIDNMRRNKVVFSKEEIAKELFKVFAGEDSAQNHRILGVKSELHHNMHRSNDGKNTKFNDDLDSDNVSNELNSRSLREYSLAFEKVMSSDKIVIASERDIEGRILYTSRERFEFEKDFIKVLSNLKGELLPTNIDNQQDEQHILNTSGRGGLGVTLNDLEHPSNLEHLLDGVKEKLGIDNSKIRLSDQQKSVVLGLVNGGRVSVVEGLPGAGKTTTMKEVVRQYKKAGYNVIGTAVSSSAARELGSKAGIKSMNITKLRLELDKASGRNWKLNLPIDYYKNEEKEPSTERESEVNDISTISNVTNTLANYRAKIVRKVASLVRPDILNDKTVLIVDESSMVDLTEMHYIVSELQRTGAKMVLLGDMNQLSSVGIKGAAEKIASMFGVLNLTEVKRQTLDEHRKATELLSKYKIADAVSLYRKSDVFKILKNSSEAKDDLVREYITKYHNIYEDEGAKIEPTKHSSRDIVALSYTNEDTKELNSKIRSKLRQNGVIYGKEVSAKVLRSGIEEDISFAKGDRVVFRRNSNYLGVHNSDIGEVIGFGKCRNSGRDTIKVKLEHDKSLFGIIKIDSIVEIDNFYYKGLDHGYAINIYQSQGKTYKNVLGLITPHIGYHSFNVMATRHEDYLKLFGAADVLKQELYSKISLDHKSASEEFDVKSDFKDKDSQYFAGIVALAQKRDNRSFADDYKDIRYSLKGERISEYIDTRSEVIKVRQAVDEWLKLERLEGRIRYLNEAPHYEDLKELLDKRKSLAENICDNYPDFKEILIQAGVNYNTIEKHAERGEYKYFFSRKANTQNIRNIKGIKEFVELQAALQNTEQGPIFEEQNIENFIKLHSLAHDLNTNFEETKLGISSLKMELNDLLEEKASVHKYIQDGTDYVNKGFKSFISKTYENNIEEVLQNWEELKSKHISLLEGSQRQIEVPASDQANSEELILSEENEPLELRAINHAVSEFIKKPGTLGKLKGIGISSLLPLSKERSRAQDNVEMISQSLKLYEEYKEALPTLGSRVLKVNAYEQAISEKEYELKRAESNLPPKELMELVSNTEKVTNFANEVSSTVYPQEQLRGYDTELALEKAIDFINSNKSKKIISQYKRLLSEKKDIFFERYNETNRSSAEYIRERDELLKGYEYSKRMDDGSRIFRHLAGSAEPDLAFMIIKNSVFKRIENGEAVFAVVDDKNSIISNQIEEAQALVLKSVNETLKENVSSVRFISSAENELENKKFWNNRPLWEQNKENDSTILPYAALRVNEGSEPVKLNTIGGSITAILKRVEAQMIETVGTTGIGNNSNAKSEEQIKVGKNDKSGSLVTSSKEVHIYSEKFRSYIKSREGTNIISKNINLNHEFDSREIEKLENIKSLNPEFPVELLQEYLNNLHKEESAGISTHNVRKEILNQEWMGNFKSLVMPKLEELKLLKSKASNISEFIFIIEQEKQFCTEIYTQYKRAVHSFEDETDSHQIGNVSATYRDNPEISQHLQNDAANLEKFNIRVKEQEFDNLKESANHGFVADKLYSLCQRHFVKEITHGINFIERHGFIEEHGTHFADAYVYLEHHMQDEHINRYLRSTKIEHHFNELQEQRVLEQDHIHNQSKSFDIDRG